MQDQRGLARPVGAQQGDALAPGHGEVDAEEGLAAVRVGEGQVPHLEQGVAHESESQPSRAMAPAVAGRARETTHWRAGAPCSARTGSVPSKPRASMAR